MKEYASPAAAFADAGLQRTLTADARRWSCAHADDLVSEAILHVVRVWPQFPNPTDVVIRLAARRRMQDLMRRERRHVVPIEDAAPDEVTVPADMGNLVEFLDALKPEHRLVLFLVYSWGFAQYQVAQALGVGRGYVAKLLGDAIRLLREAPAWHNPSPDIFLALRRRADGWVCVAQVEAHRRDEARRLLARLTPGVELPGSDMKTETL